MIITVNGKSEVVQAFALLDLLNVKKLEPQMVAVELNDRMVERNSLTTTPLKEGDRVEFLFYMGGGL